MSEKEIENYIEQYPSLKKLYEQTKLFGVFNNDVKKIKNDIANIINTIAKYNEYFSDYGWIAYDELDLKFMNEMITEFEKYQDYEKVKSKLINYYKNIELIKRYINSIPEFKIRDKLIYEAIDAHLKGNYNYSVLQFLVLVDGIVNDYTKKCGFFSEKTDVDVWDCIVGANDGLYKLKNMYYCPVKKTSEEKVELPLRNGILHGRILNYGNEDVSTKCIVLIIAVANWIRSKNSEESRRKEYEASINPPSIKESINKYITAKKDREIIKEWKPKNIVIGKDIPDVGQSSVFDEFEDIKCIIEALEFWQNENYGFLSDKFSMLLCERTNRGKMAKECRDLFEKRKLKSFKILNYIQQAICMSKIEISVDVEYNDKISTFNMIFGLLYESDSNRCALPCNNNGKWTIMPQDVRGLYKCN